MPFEKVPNRKYRNNSLVKYSLAHLSLGLQIMALTQNEFRILKIISDFVIKCSAVFPGQQRIAGYANCNRSTVHRAFKKFEKLGWVKIVSGMSIENSTHGRSNEYFFSEEMKKFFKEVDQTHLIYYIKHPPKDPKNQYNSCSFGKPVLSLNATPNATLINTNTTSLFTKDIYTYAKNVHNSEYRIPKKEKINYKLQNLPLSEKDKVYFSRYSDRVLDLVLEKAQFIGTRYKFTRGLGAYMNTACYKTARSL